MSISLSRKLTLIGCACVLIGCARDPLGNLINELSDPDVEVRRGAARTLEEQPNTDERAIAALSKGVADQDAEVRYRSVDALGKIGPLAKSSLTALKTALHDPEKKISIRAAFTMHRIDPLDRSFEPVLTNAMREGDGKTLLEVGAMGEDSAWAVPTLIELLTHRSAQVRALAAQDLGQIGPAASGAKAALQATLRDSKTAVKRAAQGALNRIEPKSAGEGG